MYLLRADIKFIARNPILLVAMCAPIFIVLIMRLVFPLISGFVYSKTGFLIDSYYTIAAITIVSAIPLLYGMVYAFILLDENDSHVLEVIDITPAGKRNFIYMRAVILLILSFLMLLLSIAIIDPVPSEGWLRNIFISLLLSSQSSFAFLFIGSMADNKVEGMVFSKLYGIFLIAVPFGMILHHPWNYLAFYSPLYWISWTWITPSISESILYGLISILITTGSIVILFRHFLKKHSN